MPTLVGLPATWKTEEAVKAKAILKRLLTESLQRDPARLIELYKVGGIALSPWELSISPPVSR